MRYGWRVVLVALLLALSVMMVQSQEKALRLIVEYEGKLYVMMHIPQSLDDLPEALIPLNDGPERNFSVWVMTMWSPDGTKVLFDKNRLWDGTQSIGLNFNANYMVNWTEDGRILYMNISQSDADPLNYFAEIGVIRPEAEAQPERLANLPIAESLYVGCLSGMLDPLASQLWYEVGMGENPPLLALTPYGLLYNNDCPGWGLTLYRFSSGEEIPAPDLERAVLSPDQSRVAGLIRKAGSLEKQIGVWDLLTLQNAVLPTAEPPTVVTWGPDGSLYYASATPTRSLLSPLSAEQAKAVTDLTEWKAADERFMARTVRIHHLALDGTDTVLLEQDAYQVGRFMFSGNNLVYSTIANGDAWIKAIVDGVLTKQTVYSDLTSIPVTVHIMSFDETGIPVSNMTLPGNLRRVTAPR